MCIGETKAEKLSAARNPTDGKPPKPGREEDLLGRGRAVVKSASYLLCSAY